MSNLNYFKNRVRNFSGKVKISDIESEFEKIVDGINSMVDTINEMNRLQDNDFSKGSVKLSGKNYTLTLGALKQVLNLYNGTVLGGTTVSVNGGKGCKVFPSLYVDKTYGIGQIPDSALVKNTHATEVYFNPLTEQLGFAAGEVMDVESQDTTTYTNINNNNIFGSITGTTNSTGAYMATTNTGWTASNSTAAYSNLSWVFPRETEITNIAGSYGTYQIFGGLLKFKITTLEGIEIYNGYDGVIYDLPTNFDFNVSPTNIKTRGIIIQLGAHVGTGFIKNLSLTVKDENDHQTTGTLDPTGIEDLTGFKKVILLDWKRGQNILNTLDNNIFTNPDSTPNITIKQNYFDTQTTIPFNNQQGGCFLLPNVSFVGDNVSRRIMYITDSLNHTIPVWDVAARGGSSNNSQTWAYNPIWFPKNVALSITPSGAYYSLNYNINKSTEEQQ